MGLCLLAHPRLTDVLAPAGRCYTREEMPTVPSITPPATAGGMSVSKMTPGIMIGQRLEMIVQVCFHTLPTSSPDSMLPLSPFPGERR